MHNPNPLKMKNTFRPAALLLTALALAGCLTAVGCQTKAPQATPSRVLETPDFTLSYSNKTSAGPEVEELAFQHPLDIGQRRLMGQMRALKYQGNALVSEPTHVFTKDDILKVRRLLTKALNKADPQNVIGFEIRSEEGATRGIVFASGGKLYWRFEEIQGMRFNRSEKFNARHGTAWRLLPQKDQGQKLFVSDKLFGSKTWENWIVAEIDAGPLLPETGMTPNPTPAPPPGSMSSEKQSSGNSSGSVQTETPVETPQQPSLNPELEKKLEFLKSLRDRNLIGDLEYQEKRRELLDTYF